MLSGCVSPFQFMPSSLNNTYACANDSEAGSTCKALVPVRDDLECHERRCLAPVPQGFWPWLVKWQDSKSRRDLRKDVVCCWAFGHTGRRPRLLVGKAHLGACVHVQLVFFCHVEVRVRQRTWEYNNLNCWLLIGHQVPASHSPTSVRVGSRPVTTGWNAHRGHARGKR